MFRLSSFLATVAICAAVLAISVSHLGFPPVSYEGMVLISAVAVVMAIGAGGLSLLLAVLHLIIRKHPRPLRSLVLSILALLLAASYLATM